LLAKKNVLQEQLLVKKSDFKDFIFEPQIKRETCQQEESTSSCIKPDCPTQQFESFHICQAVQSPRQQKCGQVLISSTFYVQLLRLQVPKVPNNTS